MWEYFFKAEWHGSVASDDPVRPGCDVVVVVEAGMSAHDQTAVDAGRGAVAATVRDGKSGGVIAAIKTWWSTPMGSLTYNGNGGAMGVGVSATRQTSDSYPTTAR
jgi:hypothetical protein